MSQLPRTKYPERPAKGLSSLNQNKYEQAYEQFQAAWKRVSNRLTLFAPTFSSLNWSVTALRRWAASLSPEQATLRKKLIKQADRHLRLDLLMSWIYIGERSHTLREAGLIEYLKNKPDKALCRLQQSLTLSEKLNDLWSRALTLLEIGKIEQELGQPGAQDKIDEANSVLEKIDQDAAETDELMLT